MTGLLMLYAAPRAPAPPVSTAKGVERYGATPAQDLLVLCHGKHLPQSLRRGAARRELTPLGVDVRSAVSSASPAAPAEATRRREPRRRPHSISLASRHR